MKFSNWRTDNGLTQREAAIALGVHEITVARWECGDRFPNPQMQGRILDLSEGAVTPNDWMAQRHEAA